MILKSVGGQWKWLMTLSIAFIFLVYLSPSTTEAHSTLERTIPKAGATVDKPPAKVELWFEDPVVVHSESIKVVDEKGNEVQRGKPFTDTEDPKHIILFIQENLPPGIYTVQYNLIALDGYVIRDRFEFTVNQPSSTSEKQDEFNLVKASPADGEVTQAAPSQIELWFSHPAQVSAFGVFDKDTQLLAKEPYTDPSDPRHIIVPLKKPPSPGTYQVTWYAAPLKNSGIMNQPDFVGVFYFSVNKVNSLVSNQIGRSFNPSAADLVLNMSRIGWHFSDY